MMNLKRTFRSLLLVTLLLQTITFYAQAQITVSGTVVDATSNQTLPGVNIRVDGTVLGTITNPNGDFTLTVNQPLPFTLIFSYVGYQPQEIEVTQTNTILNIRMEEQVIFGQEVVVSASRFEESILKSPVSIEKLDILDIQNTASASFYDGLANLKGVDFSTQSLTFKSVNARGFGANGNTRFVQLIDGIDNQAPGLNFAVGNIVGINDLDLESAEMIPGAASALYGPNAIQGILLLNSKSPFEYQGLSAYAKTGVNHVDGDDDDMSLYHDYGVRWAKSFDNKLAFKVTASYLRANDFIGVDDRDQSSGVVERGGANRQNNRLYDGVNVYGDFLFNLGAVADDPRFAAANTLIPRNADGLFTPTGYSEASFVDNTTESIKLGGALHYRINDQLEILGQFNWGAGSTVYTANDRFVLDDFTISTAKIELRGSNFFARAYTTQENSGDSYAANTLASLINQNAYLPNYIGGFVNARLDGNNVDGAHAIARAFADANQPQPGSTEFNNLVGQFRSQSIADGGAKFLDKSDLYHFEGSYDLSDEIDFADFVVGANFRRYALNSEGTLFALENDGSEVGFNEYGGYIQGTKSFLNDQLRVSASARYDKNEFFKGQLSPRVSVVGTIANDHNLRASFQRGFRIPTTQDQFIDLDVVTRRLIGSNDLLVDRYNFTTNTVYNTNELRGIQTQLANGDITLAEAVENLQPEQRVFNDFKTEKVNTFEVGYKGLLLDGNLMIDAYYYYSQYEDFIAEIDFIQAVPNGLTNPGPDNPSGDAARQALILGVDSDGNTVATQRYGFDINADGNVESHGWAFQAEYSLPMGYKIGGNVAYNELISQDDLLDQGFRASYNTPEFRYNISLSNRKVTDKLGFNISYRWQQGYLWESSFGVGVIPEFATLDAQVSYKVPEIKSTIKIGGSNILNERYSTSFGNPQLGAIYYFQITFDEFFK